MTSGGDGRAVRRRSRRAAALLSLTLAIGIAGAGAQPGEQAARPSVRLLELEGVVSPFSARYLERELRAAEARGDRAVVLRLDTPGGLLDSTRVITQAMLASRVPVIVYVAPAGARAASAGMFLLMAGHVAAMAPGTHVGAAHPVQLGGEDVDGAMAEKVVNDAAAMARALAAARGRNAEWAERTVRESVSETAGEAAAHGAIDLVAPDLDALLEAVNGRTVVTAAGPVRLETAGTARVRSGMSLPEQILQAIVHPNVAYLLFTLGMLGIAAELYSPGLLFPGITGVIALLLAFAGFGVLPVSWAGMVLLAAGVALIATDLYTEGVGVLGVGGLAAFVAGSLLLYSPTDPASPALPDLRVSGWLVGVMAASIGGFFFVVGRALLRTRRGALAPATGAEAMVGRTGIATSDLDPAGTVSVGSETWSALSKAGPISRGQEVRVLGVEGVRLRVAHADHRLA